MRVDTQLLDDRTLGYTRIMDKVTYLAMTKVWRRDHKDIMFWVISHGTLVGALCTSF